VPYFLNLRYARGRARNQGVFPFSVLPPELGRSSLQKNPCFDPTSPFVVWRSGPFLVFPFWPPLPTLIWSTWSSLFLTFRRFSRPFHSVENRFTEASRTSGIPPSPSRQPPRLPLPMYSSYECSNSPSHGRRTRAGPPFRRIPGASPNPVPSPGDHVPSTFGRARRQAGSLSSGWLLAVLPPMVRAVPSRLLCKFFPGPLFVRSQERSMAAKFIATAFLRGVFKPCLSRSFCGWRGLLVGSEFRPFRALVLNGRRSRSFIEIVSSPFLVCLPQATAVGFWHGGA